MNYDYLLEVHKTYGTKREDILNRSGFHEILEDVVIAPWWDVSIFDNNSNIVEKINDNLYNIRNETYAFSYIQLKAIGAPIVVDTMMNLGITKCKRIIFIGSVGSLCEEIKIGDIVIPNISICGEGSSRYLNNDLSDDFGKEFMPEKEFADLAINCTQKICEEINVSLHVCKNYSVDTIFLQYAHVDLIKSLGARTIEMETSVFFKAAKTINVSAVALLSVSDNTVLGKGLYSGRTEEEQKYRKYARSKVIPSVVYNLFKK